MRILLALALVLGVWATPARAATIRITGPEPGSTVKGMLGITAEATATAGDTMSSIGFFDGDRQLGSVDCGGQVSCTAQLGWDATGLSGVHILTARTDTPAGDHTTSAPVRVIVQTPPPSVTVTSPGATGVVLGQVPFRVRAVTDQALDDWPDAVGFYDNGQLLGTVRCPGTDPECDVTLDWAALGALGPHHLSAIVHTHRGVSAGTGGIDVIESGPPVVRITSPTSSDGYFGFMLVTAIAETDAAATGFYPASIEVYDGLAKLGAIACPGGSACTGSVPWSTAGLTGVRHLTARVLTTATYPAIGSPDVAVAPRVRPHAKPSCKLSGHRVHVRRKVRATCTVARLPQGAVAQVRSRRGRGKSHVVATAVADGRGRLRFSFRPGRRGRYALSVTIRGNAWYMQTTRSLGRLRVG